MRLKNYGLVFFLKLVILILILPVFGLSMSYSQVLHPDDPIVEFDPENPPARPPAGQIGKWVKTTRVSWDTDSYKAYIYKDTRFRLKFPKTYDPEANDGKQYPMVIMLHGKGETGTIYDNENQLKHGAKQHRDAVDQGKFDGYVMFPQSYGGWGDGELQEIADVVAYMIDEVKVDPNRVVVHGLSNGGKGVWNFLKDYPNLIAGVLPMSGTLSDRSDAVINDIKHIPIWLSQGGKDTNPTPSASQSLVDLILSYGGNIQYSLYEDLGHGVWNRHYSEKDFFPFILRANKTNPWPLFEQKEFCPGDDILVTLGVTAGFDGYEWRKDGVVISGANANELEVTEIGVYDVRIKRGTEWSYWSPIPIEVKIKEATITPPIQLSELYSKVIPSPDGRDYTVLELPEGYEEYIWKLNGFDQVLGSERTLTVTNPGNYIASVTEKFGCSSNYSDAFTVIDANGINPPDAINGLTAYALSKTEVQLNWSDNPNAIYNETGFEIYRGQEAGGPYELVAVTAADELSYLDNGLNPDQEYFYIIRPVNNTAAGAVSNEVKAKTQVDSQAPTAPYGLKVVSTTSTSVTLQWETSSDDVGVDKYDIYKNGLKAVVTGENTATVYNLQEKQFYNFTVKARDFTGNESPLSNQVTAAAVYSGLTYKYYHTSGVSSVSQISSQTLIKSGKSEEFTMEPRESESNFAFDFEGFLNIETAGEYTFYTSSDDGSKLYIDGQEIVNNDGNHGCRERNGTLNLAVGVYPIRVLFYQGGGGKCFEVKWKGPGIDKDNIPASSLRDDITPPDLPPVPPSDLVVTGLSYESISVAWQDNSNNETGFQVYRGESSSGPFYPIATVGAGETSFEDSGLSASTTYFYQVQAMGQYGESDFADADKVLHYKYFEQTGFNAHTTSERFVDPASNSYSYPDFSAMTPKKTGIANNFDIGLRDKNDDFAFEFEGGIKVPVAGIYKFYITSNNGSELYINGQRVSFCPWYCPDAEGGVEVQLNEGVNDIKVTHYERGSSHFLTVEYEGPEGSGISKQPIPDAVLYNITNFATTLPLPPAPAIPANIVAIATSDSEITLTWEDQSPDEDAFKIYRSTANNNNFQLLTTLPAASTSFIDEELFTNVSYFYKIAAVNVGGEGTSEEVSAKTLNNIPELSTIGDITVKYDITEFINIYSEDIDGELLTITVSNLPVFANFVDYGDGTGVIELNPSQADEGVYTGIEVKVEDQNGGEDSEVFSLIVNHNDIPVLNEIDAVISVNEGESFSVNVEATDGNEEDNLNWTISGLPSFVTVNYSVNNTAELVINPGYTEAGNYSNIEIKVEDGKGGVASKVIEINVTDVNPNLLVYANFTKNAMATAPWNNITSSAVNGLLDDKGANSGINFQIEPGTWNAHTDGAITGDNSGVYPDNVIKDYYYFGIFGAPETPSIKVSGLQTDRKYKFTFLGSSKWTGRPDNGTTIYSIDTTSVSVYVQDNSSNTASIVNVSPNSSGEITINLSKANDGTPVGYINALVIESVFDDSNSPVAPNQVAVSFNEGQIDITWNDAPYNEEGFEIYRAESYEGPYSLIGSVEENAISYVDTSVKGGRTYFYKIRAFNTNGYSDSEVAEISLPSLPPVFKSIGVVSVQTGVQTAVPIEVISVPDGAVTLSMLNLPSFASFNDLGNGQGELSLNPTIGDIGNYQHVEVQATDNQGTSSEVFDIVVSRQKYSSVFVNFSKNNAAPAPWYNTMKDPALGDEYNQLPDDLGENSGIDIKLLTNWGGVYNKGAITGDDSGIIPDNALKEYYWFGYNGAPQVVELEVSGLDPYKSYDFKFVGNSTFSSNGITDNGKTKYIVGNKSVELSVQGNTSQFGTISNILPDISGIVKVQIMKGEDATVGYLNALVIESFESERDENNSPIPINLEAIGKSKTEVALNWISAPNAIGYDVYKSSAAQGIFSLAGSVGPNETSFVDAGLDSATSYFYKVIVNYSEESKESEIVTGTTLLYSVYINMNGAQAYDAPAPWNNFGILPGHGDVYGNFKNENGDNTGIVLEFEQSLTGSNDWGTSTGDDSGVFPDNVMKSFFFMETDEKARIVIKGLDQSMSYNFLFFNAIEMHFSVTTDFTIGGKTVVAEAQNNLTNVEKISGIRPDDNNEIVLEITSAENWSIFNAMVIEAYPYAAPNARLQQSGINLLSEVEFDKNAYQIPQHPIQVSVYPNPFNDYLMIDWKEVLPGNSKFELFDLSGKAIYSGELDITSNIGTLDLDLSHVKIGKGIYILKMSFRNGKNQIIKLLKD